MSRTTKKEIQSAFRIWVKAINGHEATVYNDANGYSLDYAACYGGWCIEQVMPDGHGVRNINYQRMPSGAFRQALNLASESVREYRRNQDEE